MSTRRQDPSPAGSKATRTRPRKRHPVAEIGMRLLDDAHSSWRIAELECEQTLQAWFDGARGDGYLAYLAALEREEAAAHDLERLWDVARSGHDALAAAGPD